MNMSVQEAQDLLSGHAGYAAFDSEDYIHENPCRRPSWEFFKDCERVQGNAVWSVIRDYAERHGIKLPNNSMIDCKFFVSYTLHLKEGTATPHMRRFLQDCSGCGPGMSPDEKWELDFFRRWSSDPQERKKTAMAKKNAETTENPAIGTRYTILDQPVTNVIRWAASEGYDIQQVRGMLTHYGVEPAANTIQAQMSRGRNGTQKIPTFPPVVIKELEGVLRKQPAKGAKEEVAKGGGKKPSAAPKKPAAAAAPKKPLPRRQLPPKRNSAQE